VVATVGVGAVLIAVGWLMGGTKSFVPALLANLGTALFLFAPLLWIQRALSREITRTGATVREVQREVADVREGLTETNVRLDELGARTAERIASARSAAADTVEVVRRDVSFENVRDALNRAISLRAIAGHGVRVALPHGYRLRFRPATTVAPSGESDPIVWISLEGAEGSRQPVTVIWSAGEDSPTVLGRLAEEMQEHNVYPGDDAFDGGKIFDALLDGLSLGIEAKTAEHGSGDLGDVIELINPKWALLVDGLLHLGEPSYYVTVNHLLDDEHYFQHMLDKNWVVADEDSFREAWELAQSFHQHQRDEGRSRRFPS
jgi:hypothetical protein